MAGEVGEQGLARLPYFSGRKLQVVSSFWENPWGVPDRLEGDPLSDGLWLGQGLEKLAWRMAEPEGIPEGCSLPGDQIRCWKLGPWASWPEITLSRLAWPGLILRWLPPMSVSRTLGCATAPALCTPPAAPESLSEGTTDLQPAALSASGARAVLEQRSSGAGAGGSPSLSQHHPEPGPEMLNPKVTPPHPEGGALEFRGVRHGPLPPVDHADPGSKLLSYKTSFSSHPFGATCRCLKFCSQRLLETRSQLLIGTALAGSSRPSLWPSPRSSRPCPETWE